MQVLLRGHTIRGQADGCGEQVAYEESHHSSGVQSLTVSRLLQNQGCVLQPTKTQKIKKLLYKSEQFSFEQSSLTPKRITSGQLYS